MGNDEVRASWDEKAEEWHAHIGLEGDRNRRLNSDPVLHRLLGEVGGLSVLDAGCGTGYLAIRLARAGARVTGIDLSPRMVDVARRSAAEAGVAVELRPDDAQTLTTVADASVDRVVSNYVLMDLPDQDAAFRAIARVLVPGGVAVAVFLHPCFDVPDGPERLEGRVRYTWPKPYIDSWEFRCAWGPFRSDFIGFHRPLSAWLKAIRGAGLFLDALEEPVASVDRPGASIVEVQALRWTAYSLAVRLVKP